MGHISHGTYDPKVSDEYVFRVKRGVGNSDITEPKMTVRWRNEDLVWKDEREVSLGEVGDNKMLARMFRNGVYRTRQMEIVMSDPAEFVLSDIEEKGRPL
jgi:hypothetical protein